MNQAIESREFEQMGKHQIRAYRVPSSLMSLWNRYCYMACNETQQRTMVIFRNRVEWLVNVVFNQGFD